MSTDLAVKKTPMQLVLDLEAAGALTPVSLKLPTDLSLDEWVGLGRMLGQIGRSHAFWVGDYINFGLDAYGEDEATQAGVEDTTKDRYDQAEQVTGLARQTLLNYASVCRQVARSRRRENLPFALHAEVAYLEPKEQTKWLKAAEEKGWSKADLRRAIKGEDEDPEGGSTAGGSGGDRMSRGEQIEEAATRVWHQGQTRRSEGVAVVPMEAWSALGAALGEE